MISYDLDLSLGGSSEEKGYEAFLYDPNDAEGYIALTGIFTLVKDNGKSHMAGIVGKGTSQTQKWKPGLKMQFIIII